MVQEMKVKFIDGFNEDSSRKDHSSEISNEKRRRKLKIYERKLGLLMLLFLSFCHISSKTIHATTYDVTSYGAVGDGNTDDTNAFVRAWANLCRDKSQNPTLIIPPSKSFLIGPVAFNGPCRFRRIYVKVLGDIVAPKTMAGWRNCVKNRFWIVFSSINGLTINGPGRIDGQGSIWWGDQPLSRKCERPTALHFTHCNSLRLRGTTHINSPNLHISLVNCQHVDIGNLHIIAPGDSPNTDGIDLSASKHIAIHDTHISTGDDCVAINGGIYNVSVTRVFCGPGHGISIGSLGENGGYDTVEKVRVEHCNISGTTNGLRIKTVPGGTGYARGIVFQNINLENVQNPILIDQHYCSNMEDAACPAPPNLPAVRVSDVTYNNIYGSSASTQAITFSCSAKYKCTGLRTTQVGITGQDDFAFCQNAQGRFVSTTPIGSVEPNNRDETDEFLVS
ncbi:probable polygalacturonase At3g15720 [Rutidosis leptorrhynchoides]|uniref:probable polygalacturonase At3g15720 n=1 Tax=Rutidosis leptorrhynchoides TaxID=125765 RepID=UPI003A998125